MQQSFEPFAFARIGEHSSAQFGAVERAVGLQNVGAEMFANGLQSRLAGLDDFSRRDVRIDNLDSVTLESIGHGRFSRADSAGDSDHEHRATTQPNVTASTLSCASNVTQPA